MKKKTSQQASTKTTPHGKLWGGRFREHTNHLVETFTSSLAIDRRLYSQDVQGSIAHAQTLNRAGVLTKREAATIIEGLNRVRRELDADRFIFLPHDEDIHMAIERRLTELIGPVGGELHTGRSRNDQVTTDLRLYLREALASLTGEITQFQRALMTQARKYIDVIMPG